MDRSHQTLDARSLAMHKLIVRKIELDPSLLDRPKTTLERWQHQVCQRAHPYLTEWSLLMNQGAQAMLDVAIEDSEYATALRQSSPFTGVLSHAERNQFLKAWKAQHHAEV